MRAINPSLLPSFMSPSFRLSVKNVLALSVCPAPCQMPGPGIIQPQKNGQVPSSFSSDERTSFSITRMLRK